MTRDTANHNTNNENTAPSPEPHDDSQALSGQQELFGEETGVTNRQQLIIPDGQLTMISNCFTGEQANLYFELLRSTLNWSQDNITIAGKSYKIPRLQAWYGDKQANYDYSGTSLKLNEWNKPLLEIKTNLENCLDVKLNSVLCNLYRDGQDSVSWHSDNEKPLGPEPTIVSVSLGATRTFCIQHKHQKNLRYRINVDHNTVIVMAGTFQQYWRHQVPKTRSPCDPRINLTYRYVYS